jgi:hypothetical protein
VRAANTNAPINIAHVGQNKWRAEVSARASAANKQIISDEAALIIIPVEVICL